MLFAQVDLFLTGTILSTAELDPIGTSRDEQGLDLGCYLARDSDCPNAYDLRLARLYTGPGRRLTGRCRGQAGRSGTSCTFASTQSICRNNRGR